MNKSALLVWGGWPGHSPKECAELFGPWLDQQGYNVTISDNLDSYLNVDYLKSMDLIVPIWTQGDLPRQHTTNLLEAINSGVGIAGWHGCMGDSFRTNVEYQFMVGGQWVAHPGNVTENDDGVVYDPFIRYKVEISPKKDLITDGLSDFYMETEQYYMHVDPSNEVLATTTFNGEQELSSKFPYKCYWIKDCVMPVVWKRRWGNGKVFFSSLGHKLEDFQVPEAMILCITNKENKY
jgi:type 1 glutamine amidotransferase